MRIDQPTKDVIVVLALTAMVVGPLVAPFIQDWADPVFKGWFG